MPHLRNATLLSGLLFVALGTFFFVQALSYDVGSWRRMGPGMFPLVISALLGGVGIALFLSSFLDSGSRLPMPSLRTLPIVAGVVFFALAIQPLGLVITVICATLIIGLAEPRRRTVESVLLAAGLSIASYGLFVAGLGLRIPVWP